MTGQPWTIDALRAAIGREIGVSDWFAIDQRRIDAFADVTEDHQFIHVDPIRARETPFGGTIAHGYLILSLLSAMSYSALPAIEGASMGVNYGFDKLRFLAPVMAGSRVRGRFALQALEEKGAGRWMMRLGVTVEIEGAEKPAAIADWITMTMI